MLRLNTIVFVLLIATKSFGQPESQSNDILNVIPPSPEASALGKAAEIPVSYYTGIPNINIPIHTIQEGEIVVPISLSYHASGIKVEEIGSRVGIGWSLNAGGAISRSVQGGVADETYQSLAGSQTKRTGYFRNGSLGDDIVDASPDLHFYNFCGVSGKFYHIEEMVKIDEHTYEQVDHIVKIPFNSYTITPLPTKENPTNYQIITDNGLIYMFGEYEITSNDNRSDLRLENTVDYYHSAWYLTSIEDPKSGKTVTFEYNTIAELEYDTRSTTTYVAANTSSCGTPNPGNESNGDYESRNITIVSNIKLLSQITHNSGKVVFNYDLAREDLIGDLALTSIELFNSVDASDPVKTYELVQNHVKRDDAADEAISKRLFLDQVIEIGANGVAKPPIEISYNNRHFLPPRNSYKQDYAGYYNSTVISLKSKIWVETSWNKTALCFFPLANADATTDGADRSCRAYDIPFGTISEIKYPTGGSIKFTFQPHEYKYNDYQTAEGAGIRISEMTIHDGTSSVNDIIYKYEYFNGAMVNLPQMAYMGYDKEAGASTQDYFSDCMIRQSTSSAGLGQTKGSFVGYEKVRKYLYDKNSLSTSSYEEFVYRNPISHPDEPASTTILRDYDNWPYFDYTSHEEQRGSLAEQRKVNQIDSKTVESLVNEYSTPYIHEGFEIQHSAKIGTYIYSGESEVISETCFLETSTHTLDGIVSIKNYDYNKDLKLVTSKSTLFSDGTTQSIYYKYPPDYFSESFITNEDDEYDFQSSAINTMIEKNMISYPIETITTVNNGGGEEVTGGSINFFRNYYKGSNNFTALNETHTMELSSPFNYNSSVWSYIQVTDIGGNDERFDFKLNSNYAPQTYIDEYDDKGNPLQIRDKSGLTTSFIYAHNKSLPVAKVVNADINEIAYTSFEDGIADGWSGDPSKIEHTSETNGGDYTSLANSDISPTLPAGKYRVSFWAFSNISGREVTIPGTSINCTPEFGKGKVYTFELETMSPTQFDFNHSNVDIDDIRIYPADAQMTTYTYKPLIGITSQADENNQITKYYYDDLGRLVEIKDPQGNIVEKNNYNYAD